MPKTLKITQSHEEDGKQVCNICGKPVEDPFRYKLEDGSQRGCISTCHDKFVARNYAPGWAKPKMRLPAWITAARRSMRQAQPSGMDIYLGRTR